MRDYNGLDELVTKTALSKYGLVKQRRKYRENREELEDKMNQCGLNEVIAGRFKAKRFSNGSVDVVVA